MEREADKGANLVEPVSHRPPYFQMAVFRGSAPVLSYLWHDLFHYHIEGSPGDAKTDASPFLVFLAAVAGASGDDAFERV